MKIFMRILMLALCIPMLGDARSKEYKILDGEKIRAEVKGTMPLPAEKDGIKIEVAAFGVEGKMLTFTFGFSLKASRELKGVTVDDVSGKNAVTLVDDADPKIEKSYWRGDAAALPLTKTGVPWVFEQGNTTKVFRFTIRVKDTNTPIVLFQPAVYQAATKQLLQKLSG